MAGEEIYLVSGRESAGLMNEITDRLRADGFDVRGLTGYTSTWMRFGPGPGVTVTVWDPEARAMFDEMPPADLTGSKPVISIFRGSPEIVPPPLNRWPMIRWPDDPETVDGAYRDLVGTIAMIADGRYRPPGAIDAAAASPSEAVVTLDDGVLGSVIDPGWVITGPWGRETGVARLHGQRRTVQVVRGGRRNGVTLVRFAGRQASTQPTPIPLAPGMLGTCEVLLDAEGSRVLIGSIDSVGRELSVGFSSSRVSIPLGAPIVQRGRLVGVVVRVGSGRVTAGGAEVIDELRAACATRPGSDLPRSLVARALRHRTIDNEVVPEQILITILDWAREIDGNDSASALLHVLPQITGPRVAAAQEIVGRLVPIEELPVGGQWPIERADELRRLMSRRRVGLRHLLATSLISGSLHPAVVDALGARQAELREALVEVIRKAYPEESLWSDLLASDLRDGWTSFASTERVGASRLSAGVETAPPDAADQPGSELETVLVPGFDSDLVRRDPMKPLVDRLGVEPYVRMLTTVLASRDTPMPVSVGIFGEWGTGKSYFMNLLHQALDEAAAIERSERVADLAYQEAASVAGRSRPTRRHALCAEIRQVWFNAWNYADANLWASLAAHIFAELARDEDPEGRQASLDKNDLVANISVFTERRAELEAEKTIADQVVVTLTDKLTSAKDRAESAAWSGDDVAATVFEAALRSPEVVAAVEDVRATAVKLGISEEDAQNPEKVVADLATLPRRAQLLYATFRRNSTWLIALGTSMLVGAAVVGVVADWAVAAVGALLPVVATALAGFRWVGDALRRAEEVAARVDAKAQARQEAERSQRQAELTSALAVQADLAARIADATRQKASAQAELDAMGTTEQLVRFIGDRSAANDYHSQLGVVSIVRRDFERLSELLRDRQRDVEVTGPSIERIVLYIDDLDRCPPERVVQVLEAIHLIMALDLFVVVVGVDPRWLLRSLEVRRVALEKGVTGSDVDGLEDLGSRDGIDRPSTSLDYLEKIFQIPFALPAMHSLGLKTMLEGLLRQPVGTETDPAVAEVGLAEPWVAEEGEFTPSDEGLEDREGLVGASRSAEPSPPSIGPDGSGMADDLALEEHSVAAAITTSAVSQRLLDLSPPEIEFLSGLAPLVRTPRAAKRVANLYRLLRSTRDLTPAEVFLGTEEDPGEFQVVAELLAIVSAQPGLFGTLCWGQCPTGEGPLLARNPDLRWATFLNELKPTRAEEEWRSAALGRLRLGEVQAWRSLHDRLSLAAIVERRAPGRTIAPFQRWAPTIARFSFMLPLEADGLHPEKDPSSSPDRGAR